MQSGFSSFGNGLGTLRGIAGVFIAATVALCLAAQPAMSLPGECTGTQAVVVDNNGDLEWQLECGGTCPSSKTCKSRNASGPSGDFKFCGCEGGDFDSCCTVVLVQNSEGDWEPESYGNCPSCPLSGICLIATVGDGSEDTTAQPACSLIPSPR